MRSFGPSMAAAVTFALLSLPLSGARPGEVRISEVMYHPPQGGEYEYVEIHNHGAGDVDLGGWALTQGLLYTFPAGTIMPGDTYWVVCRQRAKVLAAHPSLSPADAFGDSTTALGNGGQRITLRDAASAVVESFVYGDDTPWDFLADGLGASLERVCFDSDLAASENWRASPIPADPTAFGGSPGEAGSVSQCPPVAPARPRVFISEIQYHPVEENSIEDEHEFIEIHSEEADPVTLDGWRLAGGTDFLFPAGTAIDPGGYRVIAKNRVLLSKVPSYGLNLADLLGDFARSLNNGGEKVALIGADGQGIDSVTYGDSFPWPEGADALGADERFLASALLPLSKHQYRGISLERVTFDLPGGLVYNWAPSPLDGATPGRANASARSFPLAIVTNLAAEAVANPLAPIGAADTVRVRARFAPTEAVSGVTLEYFVDRVDVTGEAVTAAAMSDNGSTGGDLVAGDDEYSALLPPLAENSIVRYRIKGDRGSGAGVEVISPRPTDPHLWHAYFVSSAALPATRTYQIFVSPANWGKMWNNITGGRVSGCAVNPGWDAEVPAVFVYNGEVHDVSIRYQGSRYNRTNGPDLPSWPYPGPTAGPNPPRALSWHVVFPSYNRFEGVSAFILNKLTQGCPGLDAGVGFRLFESVGNPAPQARYVSLYINGGYYHYMIEYERPDSDLIRRYNDQRYHADPSVPKETVGFLYKSVGCNCDEGPFGWGDERVLAPSCGWSANDRYFYTYDRKTYGWMTDMSDLQFLIEEMNALSGDVPGLRDFFEINFDMENLLNHIAIMNWSVPFDDMFQNHFLYQRLSDGKWMVIPWDLDLNFGGWKGASASIYMGEQGDPDNRSAWWNFLKDSFLKAYRPEFEARLLSLTNTTLAPENVARVVDEVMAGADPAQAAAAPGGIACSFAGAAQAFKDFAAARQVVVRQKLTSVIVDAGPDQTVFAGATVEFDARASRPALGPSVAYSWSNGLTGDHPTKIYDQTGTYTVTLTITAQGLPYQDQVVITVVDPPAVEYVESGGLVSIEAEHFFLNDSHGTASASWALRTSPAAGYSGAGYMLATDQGRVTFPTSFAATAPELRYAILFEGSGTYTVWIRGLSDSTDHDSLHVGIDGQARDEGFATRFTVGTAFAWTSVTRTQGQQLLTVSKPGLHILSLWIRESGQIVDKILIAKDPAYTPSGAGPAESEARATVFHPSFVRGDANRDGAVDISDALAILFHLFAGRPILACEDHGDVNDDGALNGADAVALLVFLFRSGPAPAPPFPQAGLDPTPDAYSCGGP